jgi:hypothetical protein
VLVGDTGIEPVTSSVSRSYTGSAELSIRSETSNKDSYRIFRCSDVLISSRAHVLHLCCSLLILMLIILSQLPFNNDSDDIDGKVLYPYFCLELWM